jgi:hypothetical protein
MAGRVRDHYHGDPPTGPLVNTANGKVLTDLQIFTEVEARKPMRQGPPSSTPPPGAGRARGAVGLPAVSANLGVSRALPAQTKPKRFSRSPVVRARVFAETIAVVGLGVVLGVTIGILAALYGI